MVFEDNSGAKRMAEIPRITPRNRHFAMKYHFFCQHVADGTIKIEKVKSKKQMADIFTKGLAKEAFERIRMMMMKW